LSNVETCGSDVGLMIFGGYDSMGFFFTCDLRIGDLDDDFRI